MATTVATAGILARLTEGFTRFGACSRTHHQLSWFETVVPQHFAGIGFNPPELQRMPEVTNPAAVFLPIPLSAESFVGLKKPSRRRPTAALSAVGRLCTLPYSPLAPLIRSRARLLPRGPTLRHSAALSLLGFSRLPVPVGHSTPPQPASLPPRGQRQN